MSTSSSVALLVDDSSLSRWQWLAIDHLKRNTNVEIGTVLINSKTDKNSPIDEIVGGPLLWKLYSSTRRIAWRLYGRPWYRERVPLPDDWDVEYILPEPAGSIGNTLPQEGVQILRQHEFAIRFGFGILKGEALTAPEHGVMSYHHGDLRQYRGKPAGFWELLHDEEVVGITVQRLSEDLDAGEILSFDQVDITGVRSWPVVLDALFSGSETLLTDAFQNIQNGNITTPDELGDMYTLPGTREMVTYFKYRLIG